MVTSLFHHFLPPQREGAMETPSLFYSIGLTPNFSTIFITFTNILHLNFDFSGVIYNINTLLIRNFYGGHFKSHSKNDFRCHSQRAVKGSLRLLPGLSRRSFMRRGKGNRRLSRRSFMRRRKNAPFVRSMTRAL